MSNPKQIVAMGAFSAPIDQHDFELAVRAYRNHSHRRASIEANLPEARQVLQRLDDLYGLTEYFGFPIYYPTLISTSTFSYYFRHKKDGGFKKWSYFPSGGEWVRIRSNAAHYHNFNIEESYKQQVLGRMKRIAYSLAGNDPYFAIGYSRARDIQSRSFQFEVDFEERVNEENLHKYLHEDLLSKISQSLTPHVIFSGNRSVYIAFFTKEPVSISAWMALYQRIRRFLLHSGKNDIHTFYGAGIRLPLSFHQSTHGLCRFWECRDRQSVIAYLSEIKPDSVDESRLLTIADSLPMFDDRAIGYRGKSIVQSLNHIERRTLKGRIGDGSLSLHEMWRDIHLLDTERDEWDEQKDMNERIFGPLMDVGITPDEEDLSSPAVSDAALSTTCCSSAPTTIFTVCDTKTASVYCGDSANREVYDRMIRHGIPYGSSTEVLVRSDFVRYCLNHFSSRGEDGGDKLEEIVTQGIEDPARQNDRLRKLSRMLELIGDDPRIGASTSDRSRLEAETVEAFADLRIRFKRELEGQHRSMNIERYLQALDWVLQKFKIHGTPCNLGVEELRRYLGVQHGKTAARLLAFLVDRFPVIRIRNRHHYDPDGRSGETRNFDLIPLKEWPQRIERKRRKRTRDEDIQGWKDFCRES